MQLSVKIAIAVVAVSFSGCEESYTTPYPYNTPSPYNNPVNNLLDPGPAGNPVVLGDVMAMDPLTRFTKMYEGYASAWTKHKFDYPGTCPSYGSVRFSLFGKTYAINMSNYIQGSQGKVYFTTDGTRVVKMGDAGDDAYIDMQNRDRAGLAALNGTGVSPMVFIPNIGAYSPKMSVPCYVRTITMDMAGKSDLFGLANQYYPGLRIPKTMVLDLAKSGVKLLKTVHDAGILHGDIHLGNMVFSDRNNLGKTLSVIDFGRALPFRDPLTKARLQEYKMKAVTYRNFMLNQSLLSINEILGNGITPNDDLFRFAEGLIALSMGLNDYRRAANNSPLHFKRNFNCDSDIRIPTEVCTLYKNTRAASFNDEPKYAPFL
jgi:serine/threonine protein kinase